MDDRPDERGYVSGPPPLPRSPQPVIPLAYAVPDPDPEPLSREWPIFAAWAAALVAFFVMMYEIETVLVSGPVLALGGIALLVMGIWLRRPPFILTGGSLLAICVVFLACELAFGWGPSRAETPFGAMGAAYVIVLSAYAMWIVMRHRQRRASAVLQKRT